jgi:serine phosphatase RsbU (regulator of sigma subunit)
VPDHAGDLAVSVGYRPAQGLAAGGDFYDVFQLEGERTGIILGDVSGHGRESLVQAALVRYTLRTLMGEGHPLSEVLARADRYLETEMGSNFATVIVATYDHASAELRYAKAGHEPPLITGVETGMEETATPLGLGLGQEQEWPEFSHTLMPDETVCFYTDGLKEARRNGEQLGRGHIEELIGSGLDAQELIAQVQTDADAASDDLAAVVLRMDESQPFGRFERTLSSASSSSPTA